MKSKSILLNKILLVLLVIGIALIAVSCSMNIQYADAKVESVSIYSLSKVDGYVAGDELDLSGAKLLVVYDDGAQEILDITTDMLDYTSFDMTKAEDEKVITIIYNGVSTTFTVSVSQWNFEKIEITQLPNKTIYIEGQTVDPTGAVLSVYYDGDNVVKKTVTEDMLESYSNEVGDQTIKINYFGASNLTFTVTFLKRTAVKLEIMREPGQVAVFTGLADYLSTDSMKIKITYDNAVAEIYENATSGIDTETIALNRTNWNNYIASNLYIYIDDSEIKSSVDANVAYIEPDITDTIVYNFKGTSKVRVGDIVDTSTIIATTAYLEELVSCSQGIVTGLTSTSVTVSRFITYKCNIPDYEVGDVVLKGLSLGQQAGSEVVSGISGIITAVGGGEITVRAVPTSKFTIAVKDRSYKSMVIIDTPITLKDRNTISNIIQGDTLDLSTGLVRVTFDNGKVQDYFMNDSLIKVINVSTNLRNEIPGIIFSGIENKSNVPAGENYSLTYVISYADGYTYASDSITTVVSVVDETGNINVSNNRLIVPESAKNYTVSIMVTYTQTNGEKLVSEASYIVSTVGAVSNAEQLDISAAGSHTLKIIYGGVAEYSEPMVINVIQKVPVGIIIETTTDNISNRSFYLGDALPFTSISYRIIYSNGDVDEVATGVIKNMVVNKSDNISDSLICTAIGTQQYIDIAVPSYPEIYQRIYFSIIALPIINLNITEEPVDPFLTSKGENTGGITGITEIDLAGAAITVSYYKGTTAVLSDDSGSFTLNQLINNGKNGTLPCLNIVYNQSDITAFTVAEIYEQNLYYTATLTYTDAYGESYSTDIKYYIVSQKPKSIKVSAKIYDGEWQYKYDYIQCEDWDFYGITLIATYDGANNSTVTETIDLETYMVYKTTTNTVDSSIPLVIRYLGVLEGTPSLSFNVTEREETGIVITKTGKINYVATGSGLDLSEYNFAITFNAGTSQVVNGISSFTGNSTTRGWWFEVYEAEIIDGATDPTVLIDNGGNYISSSMRITGYKMIRLKHTSEYEIADGNGNKRYNVQYVDFYIYVDYNTVGITHIGFVYNDVAEVNDIPVLGKFAVGMPLIYTFYNNGILAERKITIYLEDGTTNELELSNVDVSLDYNTNDFSTGYRTVKITYDVFTCEVYVLISNAVLIDITLIGMPTTNYISGSNITIDGGVLRATFRDSEGTFSNYVLMNSATQLLSYNGDAINSTIDLYDEHGDYIDYVIQTINIKYGTTSNNTSTEYNITIYNKQDVEFTYNNVIFFYGNAKAAGAVAQTVIEGFDAPTAITLNYISSEYFLYYTAEEYAAALLSNPNLIEIITLDEDGNEVICYVDKTNIYVSPNRPYTPVTTGYSYYILMEVTGNIYYRTRNYCYQTYLIIPKVIEVTVVNANELAYVMRVSTNNNPTAISYLYNNINSINSANTLAYSFIQRIELASPNMDYFEILMTLSSDYDQANDFASVSSVFDNIYALINSQASISSYRIIKGVNIAEYNGGQPDYITYTIASGETLTQRKTINGITVNVLDLLYGKLEITVTDGIYTIGDKLKVTNNNATLYHNNYNIDLVVAKDTYFEVTENKVSSMTVDGIVGNTLTITEGSAIIINVVPADTIYMSARIANSYEINYYTDESRSEINKIDGVPTAAGTYYAQLNLDYYSNSDGSGEYPLEFTVIVEAI